MKTSSAIFLSAIIVTVSFAVPASDESPDAPPPRPPHGALSSVTAGQRTAPPSTPAAVKQIPQESVGGYMTVGFDQLAGFPFTTPSPEKTDSPGKAPEPDVMSQVPESVKKLDGQKVIISGFMLPVKIEKGLATEFLLLNSPMMCCFGVTPSTNAWVTVKMPKGVPPVQDVPLPFGGRLHVRAQWEDGWLSSIYQLDGEGLMKPRT